MYMYMYIDNCTVALASLLKCIILHARRGKMRGSCPRMVALIKAEAVVPRPYRPRAGRGLDQSHRPRACCCNLLFFFAGCTGKFAFSPRTECPQLSQKRIWCDDRKKRRKKKEEKEETQPRAELEASMRKRY